MTQELAPIDSGQTMMSLIQRAATDEAFSVEKLEHLLAVKERWEKEEARKAYVAALADFKTTRRRSSRTSWWTSLPVKGGHITDTPP